jgi:hypothetical protein
MFRYKFSDNNIQNAIQYLKTGKGTKPSFLSKYDGSVKGGKLILNGKIVVKTADVETFVRKKVLAGAVPLSRDALFYFLQQRYANIPRATVDTVLKAQSVIRESDNRQPKTTHKSRKIHKKGILEYDLVNVIFDQLHGLTKPDDYKVRKGFFFGMTDRLTGLSFYRFITHKTYSKVTPVARAAFEWFSQQLGINLDKLVGISDNGPEFNFDKYKTWGIRIKILSRGPAIEAKNAQFQRILYRLAKMKNTTSLKTLTSRAVGILNNTKSSLHKMTPIEALGKHSTKVAAVYNKNRRGRNTDNAVKPRSLKKGDTVRLAVDVTKDKMDYKAYKAKQWSKRVYVVLAVRGKTYKIDGPIGKKYYHRDNLRVTPPADKLSDAIIKARADEQQLAVKQVVKQRVKAMSTEKTATGRKRRAASKKAMHKIKGWLKD